MSSFNDCSFENSAELMGSVLSAQTKDLTINGMFSLNFKVLGSIAHEKLWKARVALSQCPLLYVFIFAKKKKCQSRYAEKNTRRSKKCDSTELSDRPSVWYVRTEPAGWRLDRKLLYRYSLAT